MKARLETLLSIIVTLCAVVVAGMYVYLHAFAPPPSGIQNLKTTYVKEWEKLQEGGHRIGLQSAPVQIVEFGDFQCPFCKSFHEGVESLLADLDGQFSLVHYHFPLSTHSHAEEAARAAICASNQSRFADMAHALYAEQDSIGLEPWAAYARAAGVDDSSRFVSCMKDDTTIARVTADKELGAGLAVHATPTVIVNGWRFAMPPAIDSLRHFAREIADGRSPFPPRN